MRDTFIEELSKRASTDPNVFLITGDLGFGVLEEFGESFPDQFLNAGVAEQNMTAIAAGMAFEGRKVFTYSIGNFPTLRCLEQIRNDICYHNLDVTIVAIGGGFSYGQLGMSHHATEDISIMRSLPNIEVLVPSSLDEVRGSFNHIINNNGPVYLRLDKSKADFKSKNKFSVGKASIAREGNSITLIASGSVLEEALMASEALSKENIDCRVLSMHTIKPLDTDAIQKAATETEGIVTIEENNILGGLGGAVAEVCLESGCSPKFFRRVGLNDTYSSVVGDQNYLRNHYNINNQTIIDTVREIVALNAK
tara:strand:+ start:645 stop:1571 length:927 start_codon:yes stop_codon:yes gene_type:complete